MRADLLLEQRRRRELPLQARDRAGRRVRDAAAPAPARAAPARSGARDRGGGRPARRASRSSGWRTTSRAATTARRRSSTWSARATRRRPRARWCRRSATTARRSRSSTSCRATPSRCSGASRSRRSSRASRSTGPGAACTAMLELSYEFAKRLGDARAERRSLYWMGWLDGRARQLARGARAASGAASRSPRRAGDRKLQAQLDSNIGQALLPRAAIFPGAVAHLERAIALRRATRQRRARPRPSSPYSLGYLALIDCEPGRFDRADERLEEAFKLAEATGQHPARRRAAQHPRRRWRRCAATGRPAPPRPPTLEPQGAAHRLDLHAGDEPDARAATRATSLGERARGRRRDARAASRCSSAPRTA